ncbi:MAG: T9SS type A sorting domain-containing protein, partial [Bacteroidota bacterium]
TNGVTYTLSDSMATDTMTSAFGCDSIITLNLTINTLSAQISQMGQALNAGPVGATYQWVDCDSNTPILGATAQQYLPTTTGNYAVIVAQNGCTNTSACEFISIVGREDQLEQEPQLYPNPNNGTFILDPGPAFAQADLTIYNSAGQVVFQRNQLKSEPLEISIALSSGLYFAHLRTQNGIHRLSFSVSP